MRLGHWIGVAGGCVVVIAGCGGGGSSSSSENIGGSIQQALLSTLDNATSGNGTTSYSVEFTVYQCNDQNSGIPLDQLTAGDLQAAQDDMLFHCELTRNVSSNYPLAPSGSDGWLYYLEVRKGGKWDAKWEPLPVTAQDQIPPCSGALCNEPLGNGPPDEVAGDETSGHAVSAGGSSNSSPTSTSSGPNQSSAPSATTGQGAASTGGGQPGTASNGGANTIPPASVSDVGPSPCGYLPETSTSRGINYLEGVRVSCATVKKVAQDSGFCAKNKYEPCTSDGFNCTTADVNNGLDIKVTCTNTQGEKAIYNTAGSP